MEREFNLSGTNPSFQRGQQLAHEALVAWIYGEEPRPSTDDPDSRMPHFQAAMNECLTALDAGDPTVVGAFCFVLTRWGASMTGQFARARGIDREELVAEVIRDSTNPPA